MEEIEAEVDEASGGGVAIDEDVSLRQMPAPGADEERRCVLVQLVNSVPALVMEHYGSIDSIS